MYTRDEHGSMWWLGGGGGGGVMVTVKEKRGRNGF